MMKAADVFSGYVVFTFFNWFNCLGYYLAFTINFDDMNFSICFWNGFNIFRGFICVVFWDCNMFFYFRFGFRNFYFYDCFEDYFFGNGFCDFYGDVVNAIFFRASFG